MRFQRDLNKKNKPLNNCRVEHLSRSSIYSFGFWYEFNYLQYQSISHGDIYVCLFWNSTADRKSSLHNELARIQIKLSFIWYHLLCH